MNAATVSGPSRSISASRKAWFVGAASSVGVMTWLVATMTRGQRVMSAALATAAQTDPLTGLDDRDHRIDAAGARPAVAVQVARTAPELRTGLMFREKLAPDAGMLFVFGETSDHTFWMRNTIIPLDMAQTGCWGPLAEGGWSADAKTLFVLEGLVMYLAHPAVEDLLAGIACHAGGGSAVLFDFLPASLADGTSDAEGGQYIRDWTIRIGEPILSGFAEGTVEPFLAALGFSGITIVSPRDLAHRYFTGKRAERKVSGLMSLAYATVAGTGGDCL